MSRGAGGFVESAVGSVASQRRSELLLSIVEPGRDDVEGVVGAAAGHAHIHACAVERVGEERVCVVDGRSLDAVSGARVREVRVLSDVLGRERDRRVKFPAAAAW